MTRLPLVLILICQFSFGQNISLQEKYRTVNKIADLLSRHYVLIDTSEMMSNKIMSNLNGGLYDSISTHEAFANRLNADLRSVYFDKHMGIYYKDAIKGDKREWLNSLKNSNRFEWTILEENIGYLDINTFMFHDPKGKRIVNRALDDLIDVDALIIDVRDNYGGNGNMANYLIGQFLPPKRLISTVYKRRGNQLKRTKRYFSKGKLERFQSKNVPIYVLINGTTASAGESLAYGLQAFDRATVIGEKSVGAAHANIERSLIGSFLLLLPNEKYINCRTTSDFEFTGVLPDIPVESEKALGFTLTTLTLE